MCKVFIYSACRVRRLNWDQCWWLMKRRCNYKHKHVQMLERQRQHGWTEEDRSLGRCSRSGTLLNFLHRNRLKSHTSAVSILRLQLLWGGLCDCIFCFCPDKLHTGWIVSTAVTWIHKLLTYWTELLWPDVLPGWRLFGSERRVSQNTSDRTLHFKWNTIDSTGVLACLCSWRWGPHREDAGVQTTSDSPGRTKQTDSALC